MTAPAEPVRCRATKGDGAPCGVTWGLVDGLCFLHDPGRREQAEAARRAGTASAATFYAAGPGGASRTVGPEQLGGRAARTKRQIERNIAVMTYAEGIGVVAPNTLREYVKGALAHVKLINDRTLAREVRELKRQVRELKRGRAP